MSRNPYKSPATTSEPVEVVEPWLACPCCGGKAMGWWKKQCVTPLRTARCQACGKRVGVGWRAVLLTLLLPWLGLIVFLVLAAFLLRLAGVAGSGMIAILAVIVAPLCLLLTSRGMHFVRLVKR